MMMSVRMRITFLQLLVITTIGFLISYTPIGRGDEGLAFTNSPSTSTAMYYDSITLPDPTPPTSLPPGAPPGTPIGVYYDIVYVRAPRYGDNGHTRWQEVKDPIQMEPGANLMLLHPDGTEEMLVAGGDGAVVDPYVSFDGAWV